MFYTATYSPDDNKLRLYATSRLDKETYARVRAAGFIWAPKQDLFVAPMWTPHREDLLIELAGEITDEDTSLIDRAEQRADRFDDYSDKRANDAERARNAVSAIADNIPFGQPILVGHHSEKHARKDAERIENGMRKAIKMWDQSQYWKDRAASAIAHAKYKELPGVRHRRIKNIQADKRKEERTKADAEKWLKLWVSIEQESDPEKQLKQALTFANYCHLNVPTKEGDKHGDKYGVSSWTVLSNSYPDLYAPRTVQEVIDHAKKAYPRTIAHCDRWIAHYDNRLAYETAMLNEQLGGETSGGGMGGRFDIKVGGKVLTGRGGWLIVLRVNKSNGVINSVTTQAPASVTWAKTWKYGIEEIKEYEAPTEEQTAKVKKATALPPLCNYPGEGFVEMTEEQWKARRKYSDFSFIDTKNETETVGKHRIRRMPAPNWSYNQVFITDAKRVDPPKVEPKEVQDLPAPDPIRDRPVYVPPARTAFDDMKDTLKQGVKVVSAPQLFPTPSDVAKQVIELADIQQFDRVLEPSAGTGALIDQIDHECAIVAVEINQQLANSLESKCAVTCADFLEIDPVNFGEVDRIVMNPPFENGSDIKHVEHAIKFLRSGGRLVSVVANGPRQQEKLKHISSDWIDLPPGSFKTSGTNVNTAIVVIDKPLELLEVDTETTTLEDLGQAEPVSVVDQLKTKYAHLEQVDRAKYNSRLVATKNIRTELKAAFPAVKFSVTSETFAGGDAIRISWFDGPTGKQVDEITKRYQAGSFDSMTDCYNYDNDPFTALFGDAKYVTTSRDDSFAFAAQIVEKYNSEYGTACTVKASVYDGFVSPYVSHSEGDNGKLICEGSRDTHGESIRRTIYETECTEILFSAWKAPKEAQPKKKTTADKVNELLQAFELEAVRDLQFIRRDGTTRDDFRAVEVRSTAEKDRIIPIRFVLIGKKGAVYSLQNCFNRSSGKSDSPQMYVTSISARTGKTPFDSSRFFAEGDALRYC